MEGEAVTVDFSEFLSAVALEVERMSLYLEFKERFAGPISKWTYEGALGPCDEPARFINAPVKQQIVPSLFKHKGFV